MRPLAEALREWVPVNPRTNRPPSPHTGWRWSHRGLVVNSQTIKLEVLYVGGCPHTSREAIDRFFTALTIARHTDVATNAPAKRSKATEARLEATGLLEPALA